MAAQAASSARTHHRLPVGWASWTLAGAVGLMLGLALQAQPLAPIAANPSDSMPVMREGTFLVEQQGRVLRHDTGVWIFDFDTLSAGAKLPPMILQPSLNLMALQRLAEGRSDGMRFRVSGEVFTYRGRNHLLVSRYETITPTTAEGAMASDAPDPTRPAAPPELPRPVEPASDPSVAELIQALESATPDREGEADAMRAPPGGVETAADANLLREGDMLFSRTGRVVRDSTGVYVFVVDTDADSAASAEPPMRLAPSLATMALEAATAARSETLPVVISGRALLYEGRNYLLPTVFRIVQTGRRELTTAQ